MTAMRQCPCGYKRSGLASYASNRCPKCGYWMYPDDQIVAHKNEQQIAVAYADKIVRDHQRRAR